MTNAVPFLITSICLSFDKLKLNKFDGNGPEIRLLNNVKYVLMNCPYGSLD